MTAESTTKAHFPFTFWSANTIELFERAAYYAVASFVVVYLKEGLGMSPTFATFLNGSLLWGLIYFLPILSGTLADKYGFRRSLGVSFVMLVLGYVIMGNVQRFWPRLAGGTSTTVDYTIPVVAGIVLIGIGGSIVKPCIAGTVQKTSGAFATLGFGVFYMVINIGSITGRSVSYFVRRELGIPSIFFPVAAVFAGLGILIVLFLYREPEYVAGAKNTEAAPRKTLGQALGGIFMVLRDPKFVFFLVVIGLFWFLYVQLYNLIPLFLRYVDPNAPVELYTLANPVMIVSLQLLVTKIVKRWSPVKSILIGAGVTTAGMLINVLPPLLFPGLSERVGWGSATLPVAGAFLVVSIAAMAVGEMMASPRIYEYLGSIARRGEEGLYLGYANLPIALGSIVGAPIGGMLFERFIASPAKFNQPIQAARMWTAVALVGVVSMAGLALYDRFVRKQRAMV
ncbi:MAG: MFS transporter [Acidobacteriota bacterium]